ncbi:hypothetical protein [Paraburkholderia hospita]|uniref:hypothetical protein n=1 Tax=Paraburkholderia hospita TaxID=169430 RepID=UPI0013FDC843|nr:hypothetical protein [Paraburkholderia hospita]
MTHLQEDHANDLAQYDADGEKAAHIPAYCSVLQEPTASLAGKLNDRPDVVTVAILGYN